MRQNLIRRLETLETHQFGSPRVAKLVRYLEVEDIPGQEVFSSREEFSDYFKRALDALPPNEFDCLITFMDRSYPDAREQIREQLAQKGEEAAGHSPGTDERYLLEATCEWLQTRLWNLEDFLRSGTSVIAMPLHKPVHRPKF